MALAAARPLVSVYDEKSAPTGSSVVLPAVFKAPIRPDIVSFVHDQMRKKWSPSIFSKRKSRRTDIS